MTTHTPAPEHEAAIQEGERIAAADEYFKARTWIMDTNENRRIFEAGFDRAYALLSKLRAPNPLGDACHHCGWLDWVSQDGAAYCQACGKPHGSVPQEGLPNLPELLRENADLDEAEGGNAQVCALERDAADEIERLRREVAKLRAPVADEQERRQQAGIEVMGWLRENGAPHSIYSRMSACLFGDPDWPKARAALASAPVAGHQPYPAMPKPDVTHPGEQEDSYSRSAMEAAMHAAHDRGYSVGWDHGKEHASAPVAGEADLPKAYIVRHGTTEALFRSLKRANAAAEDVGPGSVIVPLYAYAAPQASEAVRIVFPTHLRKMWSGGDVQAWLDEHQGVTAPKPSAKGSLERYRKWQADRDEAFGSGVKAAADLVKKMVDDYDTDHGSTDPATGAREYPGEGATWVCEMQELEESIRALSAQPGAQREQSDAE
ncbi:hypothetical protein [Achromobacter insolitus]|uniref:hypothetical protein n=1 Tax=Achromobacter insolitus TaxID=217204 RepID=UPI002FE3F24A